jgi:hypothetical protein
VVDVLVVDTAEIVGWPSTELSVVGTAEVDCVTEIVEDDAVVVLVVVEIGKSNPVAALDRIAATL